MSWMVSMVTNSTTLRPALDLRAVAAQGAAKIQACVAAHHPSLTEWRRVRQGGA